MTSERDPSVEAQERLDALLLEGLDSGPATPMTMGDCADNRRGFGARPEKKLMEAVESLDAGMGIEVTPEFWRKRREELVERHARKLLRAAEQLAAAERAHAIAGIRAGLEAVRRGEGVAALEALEHIQKSQHPRQVASCIKRRIPCPHAAPAVG